MEHVLSWLNRSLPPGPFIRVWMVPVPGGLVLSALIFVFLFRRRKKKRVKKPEKPGNDLSKPVRLPELELANLQGLGCREEQQDAFGISRMDRYETEGLLAVLCDGMGGMAEGGKIATETAAELVGLFPWEDDSFVPSWARQRSARVYRQFRGHGGTTLVAAKVKADRLSFWCVGDSDLFLLREGKLYSLNIRQEYQNELVLRALGGAFPVEEAFLDPQAGALSEYIGKEEVHCNCNRIPFPLLPGDALLLCSDGVSDTLTLKQIREALGLPPQACCDKLEREILLAQKPGQDNYTAIVIHYHGKGAEE